MKALCLGFSSIARRRVLPALAGLEGVDSVEVASRRGAPPAEHLPPGVTGTGNGFDEALGRGGADWVYVSTVNSEHATWSRKALAAGLHVVVDKPAFSSVAEAEELVERGRAKNLVVAESMAYAAHPQVALCREIFAAAASGPRRISALFSMPPLAADNFRYRRALGGGALMDLGPYAVSLGRLFFGDGPASFCCAVDSRGGPDRIDTAFSLLASYPDGCCLVGHFGFDTEYRNEITVLGDGVALTAGRFFTTPADLANELVVLQKNVARVETAPAADSFACFLAEFTAACRQPDGPRARRLGDDLLADARSLAALRRAAGEAAE